MGGRLQSDNLMSIYEMRTVTRSLKERNGIISEGLMGHMTRSGGPEKAVLGK